MGLIVCDFILKTSSILVILEKAVLLASACGVRNTQHSVLKILN